MIIKGDGLMNLKKSVWLVAMLLGVLMWAPLSAQAALYTWDGSSSANWNNGANWDLGSFSECCYASSPDQYYN